MKARSKMIKAIALIGFLILIAPSFATAQGLTLRVNCDRGQSVQSALDRFDFFNLPRTIVVTGTCNEQIVIKGDDITLQGGIYIGSDPSRSTITVRSARRVSITGATVSGAFNGVGVIQGGSLSLDQATIRNNAKIGVVAAENSTLFLTNSTVENNGNAGVVANSSSAVRVGQNISGGTGPNTIRNNGTSGITVLRSASALIDGNTIEGNSGDGVNVEGGSATVINNVIRANQSKGITLNSSGHARIGISDTNQEGPNLVENNTLEGVQSANGSAAYIWSNTIQNNGIASHRPGVAIYRANGRLIGDNIIQGNGGHGVQVVQGVLFQGVGDFNLTPGRDIIRQNGYSGISAWNGSSLDINSATITNNAQSGIALTLRSTLRIYDSTVSDQGSSYSGIYVAEGSGVSLSHPAGTTAASITNNGFGIYCNDDESSLDGDISGVTGNTNGQVSCTGF